MTDWTTKLSAHPEPVVRPMPKARIGLRKGDLCLLPSARLVDDFIRAIPRGKAVDLLDMRTKLARWHKAAGTCPVYLGYHLRTVAEAACEARDRGVPLRSITPVWRVLTQRRRPCRSSRPRMPRGSTRGARRKASRVSAGESGRASRRPAWPR
jgi:hypothetical protein